MDLLMELAETVIGGRHVLLQNLSVGSKLAIGMLLEHELHFLHSLGNVFVSHGSLKKAQ